MDACLGVPCWKPDPACRWLHFPSLPERRCLPQRKTKPAATLFDPTGCRDYSSAQILAPCLTYKKGRKYKDCWIVKEILLPGSFLKLLMRFMFIHDWQVNLASSDFWPSADFLITSSHGLSVEFSRSPWMDLNFLPLLSHPVEILKQ